MSIYFDLLKKNDASNIPAIRDTIKYYEDNLNTIVNNSEYVNVINKYDNIDLDKKTYLVANYKDYTNKVSSNVTNIYGLENSQILIDDVLDMLLIKLEGYLNNNINDENIVNNLQSTMTLNTKNYLLNQLKNGDVDFSELYDNNIKKSINQLNKKEQKFIAMSNIYGIAGCSDVNISDKEIKDVTGLSKLGIIKALISFAILSNKMLDTIDEDESDKRRK